MPAYWHWSCPDCGTIIVVPDDRDLFDKKVRVHSETCQAWWPREEKVGIKIQTPRSDPGPRPGSSVRTFETGATRSSSADKPDYSGYLSPLVMKRFGEYMLKHQVQADGQVRASDNWQKGIDRASYMESGFRHFMDWWFWERGWSGLAKEELEEALCALYFNVGGYLHELLKERAYGTE